MTLPRALKNVGMDCAKGEGDSYEREDHQSTPSECSMSEHQTHSFSVENVLVGENSKEGCVGEEVEGSNYWYRDQTHPYGSSDIERKLMKIKMMHV